MVTRSKNIRAFFVAAVLFAATWSCRHVPAEIAAGIKSAGPLASVKTWHYQLDKIDVEKLASTPADLLVIDFAKRQGKLPLSKEEVAKIKAGPDGRGRFVIAYISVGEAESFRSYFQSAWKSDPPDWLGEENCAWPDAHRVRFWRSGWRNINFRAADSYLRRIIEQGFDGIYLDRVDIYETFEKEYPAAREEMIRYVAELARTAWQIKPGFFIIPQNAEALLQDEMYRSHVDGLGKESLLFGVHGTAQRNKRDEIAWSMGSIRELLRSGKPAFVVEYLIDKAHMAETASELRSRGVVPTFQTRALDGEDPTIPVKLEAEIGTPERTQKDCPPGTSW